MTLNNNIRILYIMLLLFFAIIHSLSYMANSAIQTITKLSIYVISIYGINIISTFIQQRFSILTSILLQIIAFIINSFCFIISLVAVQQLKVTTLPFDISITTILGISMLADLFQLWNLRSVLYLPIQPISKHAITTIYIWLIPFGWCILIFTISQNLISIIHTIWDIAAVILSTWLPETTNILIVATIINITIDIIHLFWSYENNCESCFEILPILIVTQIILQSIKWFI